MNENRRAENNNPPPAQPAPSRAGAQPGIAPRARAR